MWPHLVLWIYCDDLSPSVCSRKTNRYSTSLILTEFWTLWAIIWKDSTLTFVFPSLSVSLSTQPADSDCSAHLESGPVWGFWLLWKETLKTEQQVHIASLVCVCVSFKVTSRQICAAVLWRPRPRWKYYKLVTWNGKQRPGTKTESRSARSVVWKSPINVPMFVFYILLFIVLLIVCWMSHGLDVLCQLKSPLGFIKLSDVEFEPPAVV